MSNIKLYTVVYDESGSFMLGLKNRVSYFKDGVLTPLGAATDLKELIVDIRDEKNKFEERNKQLANVQDDTTKSYTSLASSIKEFLEQITNELDKLDDENPAYDFKTTIQKLQTICKEIEQLLENESGKTNWSTQIPNILDDIGQTATDLASTPAPKEKTTKKIFEGGQATFPSSDIEGSWTDFFEKRELISINENSQNPQAGQCIWIVKDICAFKKLLEKGIEIFANQFGGYELFYQLVGHKRKKQYEDFLKAHKSGKKTTITLEESKVISIDLETFYCDNNADETNTDFPTSVAIYIKLDKPSCKPLEKQVQKGLSLGAQYANEISQGLYPDEAVKDIDAPKTNDFNRLIKHQKLKGWSASNIQPWEASTFAVETIKKLQVLEALVKHHGKDKQDYDQDLILLKEQIELLVKSNSTSVEQILKDYKNENATPFNKKSSDTGTEKANYALYQIIEAYNDLVKHKKGKPTNTKNQLSEILGIPKKYGQYQIIKQAVCLDKPIVNPKRNDNSNDCEYGKLVSDKSWSYIFSLHKIQKNIWPQVNKIYQLTSPNESHASIDDDIKALRQKIIQQRSWQSFIINMRNDKTLAS